MSTIRITTAVKDVLEKIYKNTSPVSIFLYGSRARTDFKPDSDYEVGVLYFKDKKIRRSELAKMHNIKGLNIYPFVYEEIKE